MSSKSLLVLPLYTPEDKSCYILRGTIHQPPLKIHFSIDSNHHNFFLASVLVILEPYYCLFCVLSNVMLNISYRHTFLNDTCNIKVTKKSASHIGNSHISPMRGQINHQFGVCVL